MYGGPTDVWRAYGIFLFALFALFVLFVLVKGSSGAVGVVRGPSNASCVDVVRGVHPPYLWNGSLILVLVVLVLVVLVLVVVPVLFLEKVVLTGIHQAHAWYYLHVLVVDTYPPSVGTFVNGISFGLSIVSFVENVASVENGPFDRSAFVEYVDDRGTLDYERIVWNIFVKVQH